MMSGRDGLRKPVHGHKGRERGRRSFPGGAEQLEHLPPSVWYCSELQWTGACGVCPLMTRNYRNVVTDSCSLEAPVNRESRQRMWSSEW